MAACVRIFSDGVYPFFVCLIFVQRGVCRSRNDYYLLVGERVARSEARRRAGRAETVNLKQSGVIYTCPPVFAHGERAILGNVLALRMGLMCASGTDGRCLVNYGHLICREWKRTPNRSHAREPEPAVSWLNKHIRTSHCYKHLHTSSLREMRFLSTFRIYMLFFLGRMCILYIQKMIEIVYII